MNIYKWINKHFQIVSNGHVEFINACYRGDMKTINKLIKIIDINVVDTSNSGFIYSCFKGDLEIVKLLLDYKVNYDYQNYMGNTAFMYACANKNYEVIKLLAPIVNINVVNYNGMSAFIKSCLYGYTDVVKILFLNNANITFRDEFGYTGLEYAYSKEYIDILKLFVVNDFKYLNIINKGKNIKVNEKINEFVKTEEYFKLFKEFNVPKASNIFSLITLISDDYLKFT